MRYLAPSTKPSHIYSSEAAVAAVLGSKYKIVDFRPPQSGELYLGKTLAILNETTDTAGSGFNARFILKPTGQPEGLLPPGVWE